MLIVAVLALCIAVNVSVFSLVNTILLRPLPYPNPDTLVHVTARDQAQSSLPGCLSYDHFEFWRSHGKAFGSLAGYTNESFNLSGPGVLVNLPGARVSSNFFQVLGVRPALGRGFDPLENEFSDPSSVLISHRLWKSRFGGRADTVGSMVTLNARPMVILGVLPPWFVFHPLGSRTDVWTTSLPQVSSLTREQVQAGSCYINAVARLKPGKTLQQARTNALVLQRQFVRSYPKLGDADARREPEIRPLQEKITGGSKPLLLLLSLAVAILLLIACANVSSLFLARAAERQKNIAVMTALGATPLRVARQFIQESALLSALAGCTGLALSFCVTRIAYASLASFIPRSSSAPEIDGRVACFAVGVCVLTALFCAALPAWQVARPDVSDSLRDDRRASSGRRARTMRNSLVVSQTALSLCLLIVAGSLADSFIRLLSQPVGFQPQGVLAATVALPPAKYSRRDQIVGFYQRTLARIQALPGVQATAIASALPANESMLAHVLAEGQPSVPVAQRQVTAIQSLTGSYLRVMQIPLLRGRFFETADRQGARAVAVINRALAQSFFRGCDPIGKRIWLGADPEPWQIIGVIGDVKNANLAGPPKPEVDFAFEQLPWPQMNILARGSTDTMALENYLRAQVAQEDVEQPVTDMRTLETLLGELQAQPRLITGTVAFFAGASFLLALLGLCGAIGYSCAQRSQEFGIRLALGATRQDLVGSVLGESIRLAGAGTLLGLFSALLLVRSMRATIYGEGEMHFVAFTLAPLVFFVCSLLASLVPALWFTRLHPAEILRRS